jgi:hypothetical protein
VHTHFHDTFLMTNRWRKQLLKATDFKLFLKSKCQVWDSSNHDPLGLFVYFPLCRHEPWHMRYTTTVVELESALRILPCDDLLQKENILCNFLEQAQKWDVMPEIMVCELLQGPRGEQVPYKITEGRGWKRAR